jgi:O-antigen/teichoic acid export membrane protein
MSEEAMLVETPAARPPAASPTQGRLVADSARMSAAQVVQQAFGYLRGLILPNLLGAFHYGTVATVLLVERYANYANLGIHMGTTYKVPAHCAGGRSDEARAITDAVASFSLVAGMLASLGVAGWVWWAGPRLAPELAQGLLIASVLPLLVTLRGVVAVWLRAYRQFDVISRGTVLGSVVLLLLTLGLGWRWQAAGVLAGQALAYAVMLAYFVARGRLRFAFRLPLPLLGSLLAFSIPIHFILNMVGLWLVTADRITIARLLGPESVGYYAIGQTFAGLLAILPSSVGAVMGTELIAQAGQRGDAVQRDLLRGTWLVALPVAMASAALLVTLPAAIRLLFPLYQPAILPAQWLCLVGYFEAVGIVASYVLTSRNRVWVYIGFLSLLAAATSWVLPQACAAGGIAAVAAWMVPLTAAKSIWVVWMACRLTHLGARRALGVLASLLALGAGVAGLGSAAQWLVPWPAEASSWRLIGATLLRLGLVGCGAAAAATLVARRAGIEWRGVGVRLGKAVRLLRPGYS